jgi:hypothetical protein
MCNQVQSLGSFQNKVVTGYLQKKVVTGFFSNESSHWILCSQKFATKCNHWVHIKLKLSLDSLQKHVFTGYFAKESSLWIIWKRK